MTTEIINKLGFDVNEALNALGKLDTTLAGLEKRMASLSNTISQFNGVASQVDKIGKAIQKSMDTGTEAADRLTVSWQMMSRIVATQMIVRALSQVRRTFEDTAQSASRYNSTLTRDPIQLAFDAENGIAKAQADVQAAFKRFRVQFSVEPLEGVLGRKLNTPDEVARGLVEVQKRVAELRSPFDAAMATRKGASDTLQTAPVAAADALDKVAQRLNANRYASGLGAFKTAESALQQFREALADPNLNADKLRALAEAFQPLAGKSGIFNAQNVEDFSAALDALNKRAEAVKTLQVPLPDASQLQQLESVIQRLQAPELGNLGPAVSAGVQPSADIAGNLWSGASAAASIASSLSGLSGPDMAEYATGGMAYLASGGRGTDTIPAMLSPGEFVINARSARRFASQLTAMNAGVTPMFRQDGGTVINTNVGDIIVNGAKGPKQTAQEISAILRRGERRGTV